MASQRTGLPFGSFLVPLTQGRRRRAMRWCRFVVGLAFWATRVNAFSSLPARSLEKKTKSSALWSAAVEEETQIQWDLFKKHHALGSWKGVWTSYDYIGDVIDETIASVDLEYDESSDTIQQTHNIVSGATKSDCKTCFDSMEVKSFPVARYAPGQLHKTRLGSIGMVNGPTLLRSGAMATELALSYGDGRIRVMVQHAPVWEAGVEPGSGPPQALKLLRAMVSREALRPAPPTPETEAENPPPQDNPAFFRPVPPFAWHKEWGGTSWTWGPTSGNRGWAIEKMEEVDAWHGRPTGDSTNVWNLRLPGGVLLQVPRVIVHGEAGICRVAWLPQDDTLLRLEAGVLALEPMTMEDDTMVGFYPPSLGSLRCDVMKKIGELENVSMLVRDDERDELKPLTEEELRSNDNSGLGEVRDAMGP